MFCVCNIISQRY